MSVILGESRMKVVQNKNRRYFEERQDTIADRKAAHALDTTLSVGI